jgi:DnaJ-class molecular chaperone
MTYDENDPLPNWKICPSCEGAGTYSVGDVEDGVDEECPECNGAGEIVNEEENKDTFIPERDAWTPND